MHTWSYHFLKKKFPPNPLLLKNNYFQKKKKIGGRRVALLYIFANFFCALLNRRQLDSHNICFCIQSIVIYAVLAEVYEEIIASHR